MEATDPVVNTSNFEVCLFFFFFFFGVLVAFVTFFICIYIWALFAGSLKLPELELVEWSGSKGSIFLPTFLLPKCLTDR